MEVSGAHMHRCLKSPVIVLCILEALYPYKVDIADIQESTSSRVYRCGADGPGKTYHYLERDPTGGRGAVAALAQTCRFFLEPCLNTLWRHLFSLSPLLNCLDDTCVPLSKGEQGPRLRPGRLRNPRQFEINDPNKLNWNRFNYYAHRVKVNWTDDDDDIPKYVWFRLAASRRAPLLPRLQHLIWRETDRSKLPYLSLLCGPALQRLTVFPGDPQTESPDNDESTMVTLVLSLSLRSPLLEEVEIVLDMDGDYAAEELCEPASWMVAAMHPLRSFKCAACLDTLAFTWLSSMPALHSFGLVGGWVFRDLVASPVFFPKLEEFTVSEIFLGEMTRLLTTFLPRHSFTTISVSTSIYIPGGEIEPFVKALCLYCNPATLTHLRLDLTDEVLRDGIDRTLDSDTLIALQQFTQLREFSIKAYQIQWKDQFLKDIAPAWRSLQILKIDTVCIFRQPTGMPKSTMHSLIPLATFCPDLHSITLEICNWDDPDPVLMAIQRPNMKEHASLPMLHVCLGHNLNAPPKDLRAERRVAAVLKALFPNIRSAWNTGVEFWIRHDWPEYQDLTQEAYSISAERNRVW
ncbi:hypothetical protein EVG20_g8478 [Dentipellis fragilis]|uniref:F-box domain-containing protein n=1 Tax=Dentipellis fragilis TaxID=205917 RepID=A0A4Y9Y574_9AGAM|nr:hypothetical protein EVG20_g8478 [Dentipellis fragilis]